MLLVSELKLFLKILSFVEYNCFVVMHTNTISDIFADGI